MRTILMMISFLWFTCTITAQAPVRKEPRVVDSLALDPSIGYGKFDNGFQYYIKPTNKSKGGLEIRLMVKTGFNQEDDDQYDLSHFMEHIALRAGKHVSTRLLYGTELSRELGISRGSVTAYTARDFTEYIMKIPHTKKAKDFAFQLVRDIMVHLEFKDHHIEMERSPFFDENEVRGGESSLNGKDFLLDSKILDCGASAPADYLTYIRNFPKRKLERFYQDWYRPDLMGLMVTGDIKDSASLQEELKKWFSPIPTPKHPRKRVSCNKVYRGSPARFVKQERPLIYKDHYGIDLYYRLYFKPSAPKQAYTGQGLENQVKEEILLNILQERFKLLKEMESWSFEVTANFADYPACLKLNLKVPENYSKKALIRTLTTLRQVRKYGILPEELENAKARYLQFMVPTESNRYWLAEIRKHFVQGEALPSQKNQLLTKIVEQLSEAEIEEFFNKSYAVLPEDIGLIAPSSHRAFQLKETTIRSWLAKGQQEEVAPFEIPELLKRLIDSVSLKNLKEKKYRKLVSTIPGAKHYELANGLELVLKPIEVGDGMLVEEGEFRFLGMSQKGAQCFPEEDYFSAINAPGIIAGSGVGGVKPWQLKKYLKTKSAYLYAYPYIHNRESGIEGKGNMKDLETALQLVYLYFTQPNKDRTSFELWKKEAPDRFLRNIKKDDFRTKIEAFLGHVDYLPTGTQRMEGVSQTDLDRAYTIYQSLFGNAEDFIFLFSGDFDQEKTLQLCNKYLGNLPNTKTLSCQTEREMPQVRKAKNLRVVWESAEIMNNSLVNLFYRTKVQSPVRNWKEEIKLELLANLMDVTLMKELRMETEDGGPYSIRVLYQYDPKHHDHELVVLYSCQPEDQERLDLELRKAIKDIHQAPIDQNMFETVVREFLSIKKENNYNRLHKLATHTREQAQWYTQRELRDFIMSLTPNDVHKVAIDNLRSTPIEFILMPKKDKQNQAEP